MTESPQWEPMPEYTHWKSVAYIPPVEEFPRTGWFGRILDKVLGMRTRPRDGYSGWIAISQDGTTIYSQDKTEWTPRS